MNVARKSFSRHANAVGNSRPPRAANVNASPGGYPARFNGRSSAARSVARVAVERRYLAPPAPANIARRPVPVVGIPRGVEVPVRSGLGSVLSPGVMIGGEVVGALSQSVWDSYLLPPGSALAVRDGAFFDAASGAWKIRTGTTSVVIGFPADPGRRPDQSNGLNAFIDTRLDGFGLAANSWFAIFGTTPATRVQISAAVKRNIWEWNVPWQNAPMARPSPFYPVAEPVGDPEAVPRSVRRAVERPNVHVSSLHVPSRVNTYGRQASVVGNPPTFHDPGREKPKIKSRAYALFKALEDAGDVGTIWAAWYEATRRELRKQGYRLPTWRDATWQQRILAIEQGLTAGVDYEFFAYRVGAWWVGERVGAILGPTVRLPGDAISGNVRMHRPMNAFKDMFPSGV